jgi:RES domain-containing protein
LITVFRLFSPWRDPWDAAGAFLQGGRWNSPGKAVLYTASSLSLACLEILVHIRNPGNFPVYSYSQLAIPKDQIEPWESSDPIRSPERRKAIVESEVLSREEGDIWIRERQRDPAPHQFYTPGEAPETGTYVFARPLPVRQVPSAVVPQEWNYLIDPEEETLR